ncbi:putative DNA-directed RNA polymerase subunit [Trypanosoma rangeli]|uniref:Putative DNA-directed RNA polymerase subunit n=1 Tax=Trypanosoma rangeli TaxID=5698 RepID=A0A422NF56_TRYRA|nr:putative DNA-directed RNA polymerase subunit [Trypanosoma rangeli]RNF04076.1 putative DNA-directed RNA polymerase subunit [Trypanosoma rangeli]|eukprot:RNF04076.1 putative DNA-directed RNA polymerase subunit [Trypanosoma rangeli]
MIRSDLLVGEESVTAGEPLRITPVHERKTSAYLTKYEMARVIGERARQIVNGTSVLLSGRSCVHERSALELAERCSDPYSLSVDPVFIAKMDLLQGRIPMIVRRAWPCGAIENIPVSELLIDKVMLNMQN